MAEGEERESIWARQVKVMPGFAGYESKTTRKIPVVILERKQSASSGALKGPAGS